MKQAVKLKKVKRKNILDKYLNVLDEHLKNYCQSMNKNKIHQASQLFQFAFISLLTINN